MAKASWEFYIRWIALLLLTFQAASHAIVMRYSRGILKEKFITTGAVIMMEVVKGVICVVAILRDPQLGGTIDKTVAHCVYLLRTALPLSIPAGVYFIQNNLAFLALQHLDAPTFNVLAQLKLLTAAVFAVILLKRRLSSRKWRALFLLIVGVVLIILATDQTSRAAAAAAAANGEPMSGKVAAPGSILIGVAATIGMVSCSGLAGVYFEKVLKSTAQVNLFERNVQLSFYSIIFGLVQLLLFDATELFEKGFFYDYSRWTWANIMVGAVGGIIVAVVVKYTDTIMKGFATSAAIVLTSFFSHFVFGTELDAFFALGVAVVIISIFNYSEEDMVVPASNPAAAPLAPAESFSKAVSPSSSPSALSSSQVDHRAPTPARLLSEHTAGGVASRSVEIELGSTRRSE